MTRYSPIQTERLYEQIVDQIEDRILSGVLKVGDKLPSERELAEQFTVSRTAVREAVKILVEKGLIEIRAGRGTFVMNGNSTGMRQSFGRLIKPDSIEGLASLLEVRELLEPETAALAASRMTDEYISAMREAVQTMDTAYGDTNLYVEADLDFHLALAEATQNLIIPALMDTLIDLLREQRKRLASVEGSLQRAQVHHKEILEAVNRQDPEAARRAMQRHLQQIREDDSKASTLQRD